MQITLIEPFFTGSHKKWAEGIAHNSQHDFTLLTLPGRHWKWRMHGAAVTFATILAASENIPDLILTTDMLDVATFKGLLPPAYSEVPILVYFHENQLTYPWSPGDQDKQLKRDNHYSFINYTSALAADAVWFNSAYHQQSFLTALPGFLDQFPDARNRESIKAISERSRVVPLGMDLSSLDRYTQTRQNDHPVILWNHRWEYDKNPEAFYTLLKGIAGTGIDFSLVVLGEHYTKYPAVFDQIKTEFNSNLLAFGYADKWEEYAGWLWRADIIPVTSNQDFFGGSLIEAMYCGTVPILPRRLAYPEHISDDSLFYHTDDELLKKTLLLITSSPSNKSEVARESVSKYDWKKLIPVYDELLAAFS